uniref:Uncharacterized protein n=1 Tax=viral metagenome TaxID=1070528 RepID=A0A6M3JE31_9ZZZZ
MKKYFKNNSKKTIKKIVANHRSHLKGKTAIKHPFGNFKKCSLNEIKEWEERFYEIQTR